MVSELEQHVSGGCDKVLEWPNGSVLNLDGMAMERRKCCPAANGFGGSKSVLLLLLDA